MEDFLGNKLEVGDPVVFITPGYRDFSKGKILRFTKCYVFIEKEKQSKFDKEIKQFPNQLIKINKL